MSIKNGHNAYLKIPGFWIGANQEGQTDATPAELSAKLTVEEQSFLDSLAG